MTDREKDRTMKEIISDAVERRLAKEPSREVSFEEFTALIEKAEMRRKKRRLRMVMYAAMFFIAIIGAAAVFNTLTTDVGANKNEKEEIVTEDGVVIEDGGYGASEGEANTWSTTDWGDVSVAKEHYKNLLVPGYIPERYTFESLMVELLQTENEAYEYLFSNGENQVIEIEIYVQRENLASDNIYDGARKIESSKGSIYIQEDENKIATIRIDDGIHIKIWGELTDKEIIEIIDNLNG